jgi:soluble lytic murein transglycosylase-like protein
MMKNNLSDRVALSVAKARKKAHSKAVFRILGGRGALTLLVGAALSIGGLTDAVQGVHYLVEKNLDSVQVVQQKRGGEKVVATLADSFASNTVFKLAQILPDRYVTRELSLFDEHWLPITPAEQKAHNVFFEEMSRISTAIRRSFFEDTIPFGDIIHAKAAKYDVDPSLVAAVIEQESRFHTNAKSPVGARGLMQLMPKTGRWMGARDLYDAEQNIDAGVKYIKYLEGRFDGNLKKTIAAYNAGEGNVRRYRGIPPFRETQHYVRNVLKNYDKRQKQLKQFHQDQIQGGTSIDPDVALTVR